MELENLLGGSAGIFRLLGPLPFQPFISSVRLDDYLNTILPFSFCRLLGLSSEAIKQEEVCPTLDKLRERGPLTAFLQYGWHLAYWNGELTLGTFLKHHIAQLDSFKVRGILAGRDFLTWDCHCKTITFPIRTYMN